MVLTGKIKVLKKFESLKGNYTNYYLNFVNDNGFNDSVPVPKDVYLAVEEGDDVTLEVAWFYNRKEKKYMTFVSGLALGKVK